MQIHLYIFYLIKDDKADLSLILSQDIPIKNFGDLDPEIKEKNKYI